MNTFFVNTAHNDELKFISMLNECLERKICSEKLKFTKQSLFIDYFKNDSVKFYCTFLHVNKCFHKGTNNLTICKLIENLK